MSINTSNDDNKCNTTKTAMQTAQQQLYNVITRAATSDSNSSRLQQQLTHFLTREKNPLPGESIKRARNAQPRIEGLDLPGEALDYVISERRRQKRHPYIKDIWRDKKEVLSLINWLLPLMSGAGGGGADMSRPGDGATVPS